MAEAGVVAAVIAMSLVAIEVRLQSSFVQTWPLLVQLDEVSYRVRCPNYRKLFFYAPVNTLKVAVMSEATLLLPIDILSNRVACCAQHAT